MDELFIIYNTSETFRKCMLKLELLQLLYGKNATLGDIIGGKK